jgi:hypothetical protein
MESGPKGRRAILAKRIAEHQKHIALCTPLSDDASNDQPDENRQRLSLMLTELEQEQLHKRVVLLGIEHGCQRNGDGFNQELGDRIQCLKEQLAATVLMEEWSQNAAPSFASTLGVPYQNIGTNSEERFETYWSDVRYPGYIDGTLDNSDQHPSMAEYGPLRNQENRENQMVENVRQAMTSHDVGILLIGLAHLHSMCQKLLSADFNVSAFTWLPSRTEQMPVSPVS